MYMDNTQTNKTKESLLSSAHGFEAKLIPFFAKFPHIPEGGRKVIADISPWIALVFGILGLFALLGAGALMTLFAIPMLLTGGIWVVVGFITTLLGLVSVILQLLAFNPLKLRMKKGWNYLYYGLLLGAISTIISVVGSTVSASMMYSNMHGISSLISGVISFLIGGWILFEVRDQYKA